MFYKEILSAIAIALTLVAFYPYLLGIVRGTTKPHVFSWFIWGSTTFVVFLAQLQAGGGIGAWPIGVSGAITVVIATAAYVKRADITITRTDWLFFAAAMSSLPLWYVTSDPTWAVVLLTVVDLLGFGPTIRKSYEAPHSESLVFFGLFAARNLIVVAALESYSVATVLFPAAIAAACVLLMLLIVYRRRSSSAHDDLIAGGLGGSRTRLVPESEFVVQFDADAIARVSPNGETQSVLWGDLTRVEIRTTEEGPLLPDVFWCLYTDSDSVPLVFPGGSTGEQEVLAEMQSRLPGFDDKEFINAMGSTSNATFLVWERRPYREPGDEVARDASRSV